MDGAPTAPAGNHLLQSLASAERAGVLAACDEVKLESGTVLCAAQAPLRHVYFPVSGYISLLVWFDDASSIEVGMVGDEGMFGLPASLGVLVSSVRAVVQGDGHAWRMDATTFAMHFARSAALRRVINRYLFVHLCQLAQSVACMRYHPIEARLARWLLMTQDRAHSKSFRITQELLAVLLGVRRVGVSKAASALAERDLIEYRRGNLTVLDRRALKAAACVCYAADRAVYARYLR